MGFADFAAAAGNSYVGAQQQDANANARRMQALQNEDQAARTRLAQQVEDWNNQALKNSQASQQNYAQQNGMPSGGATGSVTAQNDGYAPPTGGQATTPAVGGKPAAPADPYAGVGSEYQKFQDLQKQQAALEGYIKYNRQQANGNGDLNAVDLSTALGNVPDSPFDAQWRTNKPILDAAPGKITAARQAAERIKQIDTLAAAPGLDPKIKDQLALERQKLWEAHSGWWTKPETKVAQPGAAGDTSQLAGAVKQVESGGNPNAVSPKGAVGTMQTMPATLTDPGFGVAPAKDNSPQELERVGKDYLNAMVQRYQGQGQNVALAAYNWGPGNVDKWLATGPKDFSGLPPETQQYIQKVNQKLQSPTAVPFAVAPTQPAGSGQPQQPFQVKQGQYQSFNNRGAGDPELAQTNAQIQNWSQYLNHPNPEIRMKAADNINQLKLAQYDGHLRQMANMAGNGDTNAVNSLLGEFGGRMVGGQGVALAQGQQPGTFAVINGNTGKPLPGFTGDLQTISAKMYAAMSPSIRQAQIALATKEQGAYAEEHGKSQGGLGAKLSEVGAQGQVRALITQMENNTDLQKAFLQSGVELDKAAIGSVKYNPLTGDGSMVTSQGRPVFFKMDPKTNLPVQIEMGGKLTGGALSRGNFYGANQPVIGGNG